LVEYYNKQLRPANIYSDGGGHSQKTGNYRMQIIKRRRRLRRLPTAIRAMDSLLSGKERVAALATRGLLEIHALTLRAYRRGSETGTFPTRWPILFNLSTLWRAYTEKYRLDRRFGSAGCAARSAIAHGGDLNA
jgi:hypothetical protein